MSQEYDLCANYFKELVKDDGKIARIPLWRLVAAKIRPQFSSAPEGKPMFAIVRQALEDAYRHKGDRNFQPDARRYLAGDLIHAELAGCDPQWVRDTITALGLPLPGAAPRP